MSEASTPQADDSPLRIGVVMTLVALGFAALVGVIAVVDANSAASAVGTGAGIAVTIFLAGGTIACAVACLVRARSEILALGSLAASGLAIDLFVLAIWREIDDDTYGKIAGIAFVWMFLGLVMLGLALAVQAREQVARTLYLGAMIASAATGLIASWLIATTGGSVSAASPVGLETISDESLLRPLAVALVLLANALVRGAGRKPARAALVFTR